MLLSGIKANTGISNKPVFFAHYNGLNEKMYCLRINKDKDRFSSSNLLNISIIYDKFA